MFATNFVIFLIVSFQTIAPINSDLSARVARINFDGSSPYIMSINNRNESTSLTFNLTSQEQIVFIIGAGASTTYYLSHICGSDGVCHNYGQEIGTISADGTTVTITNMSNWFRGICISYLPFTVS